MSCDGHRLRQAVGVFDDTKALNRAWRDIEKIAGIEFAVMGERPNFDKDTNGCSEIGQTTEAQRIFVGRGPLADFLQKAGAAPEISLVDIFRQLLPVRHAVLLTQRLKRGSISLWVNIPDETYEPAVCHILMHQSPYSVEVHDLVLPRDRI